MIPISRIVIDTDLSMGAPGSEIDDGFALAFALGDPDLRVELVTTVSGNIDVDAATYLTRQLLERLGRPDIPLARGSAAPLLRPRAQSVRSTFTVPEGEGARGPHAANAIIERVMAAPGEITLVCIGPLTNVALALLLEPRLATELREIVMMGGVFMGHTHASREPGEFNVWVDPDAAKIVLSSGAKLRFVGLDVTKKVRLSRADADAMARGTAFSRFAAAFVHGWIDAYERAHPEEIDQHGSCALHDPLAVAVVARPDLVTWKDAHVDVETVSETTRGVMIADFLQHANPPRANCQIAVGLVVDAFRALFFERLARLDTDPAVDQKTLLGS